MNNLLDYNQDWKSYFKVSSTSLSGIIKYKNNKDAGHKHFRSNGDAHSWRVCFNGDRYSVHRVIWVLTYGSISSDMVIDHLDGNPFNNLIDNLDIKTQEDNTRNRRQQKGNKTGTNGVSLDDKGKGHLYYKAHWRELDGSAKFKTFSVAKLGEETAKALAISYREQQVQRLILEGANYTERHGTT